MNTPLEEKCAEQGNAAGAAEKPGKAEAAERMKTVEEAVKEQILAALNEGVVGSSLADEA